MERAVVKTLEAGFVLGRSYMQIMRMVERGELVRLATGLCATSVERALSAVAPPSELQLRLQALRLLRAGRIRAPKPPGGRWAAPSPITVLPELLVPKPRPTAAGRVGAETLGAKT